MLPLRSLVDHVAQLNESFREIYSLEKQSLGKGAAESAIRAFERANEIVLPPSYREFLSLHDGWMGWNSSEHLLSLAQMSEGPYLDSILEFKSLAKEFNFDIVRNGLVIATSLHSASGLILDVDRVSSNGEMQVVEWEHEEIERSNSFHDLLKRRALTLERLIQKKRNHD